jgi:trk system potassium uptake protein TrkH
VLHFSHIGYILGFLLIVLGLAMVVPALVDAGQGGALVWSFLGAASTTLFSGIALLLANTRRGLALTLRDAFVLTTASWIVISIFGALPFVYAGLGISYTDAFFETISGLTTTGSTVLVGLDTLPRAILLWRALLQWMGGLGIIAMAMAILPFLRVGGMHLFHTESSDRLDKVLPRPAAVARAIGLVYLGLTALCAWAYFLAGMTGFEAITHAMATLATGGYSTSDASFAHFGPAAQWVGILFMTAGGLPFALYVRAVRGEPSALWCDSQVRAFLVTTMIMVLPIALWLWFSGAYGPIEALRLAAFNLVSIITTTGFAATDYSTWGGFPVFVFFLATFVGACSGSTSGGVKLFRFQIMAIAIRRQIRRLVQPHAVLPRRYNGRPVTDEIVLSVIAFIAAYFGSIALVALVLAGLGLDPVTSFTGAATALGNVGPGLGEIVGPAGNFGPLPDAAKWVLSLAMLLGRLELFTVLVLLTPGFWRA